jgi:uncharacterized repeat protein (TIGR02543 family)
VGNGGASYTPTASIQLYAKWTVNTWTVAYNANGGTGAPASQTKTYNQTLTLSSSRPARSGYTFLGWATKSDGTGTAYSPGGSYTDNAAATLYAQWNSSTSTAAVTLPTPTKTGYSFQGWNTKADGTGTKYNGGASYTPTGNVTLYAIWKANTYTVSYNANGGTGAPGNQTKTHDVALTLSSTKPSRANASAGRIQCRHLLAIAIEPHIKFRLIAPGGKFHAEFICAGEYNIKRRLHAGGEERGNVCLQFIRYLLDSENRLRNIIGALFQCGDLATGSGHRLLKRLALPFGLRQFQ